MSCRDEHTNTGKPCLLSTEANAGRKILLTLQTKRKPWEIGMPLLKPGIGLNLTW